MRSLQVGSAAPELELENLACETVRLTQYHGKKVLLSFLRNAECAVCNLWVHDTMRRAPAWRELGLEVVAVFEARADKLRAQFAERRPPFQVLADPDGAAHDAFGSRSDQSRVQAIMASGAAEAALARAAAAGFQPRMEPGANFFRIPRELLLDEAGVITALHSAEEIGDHLSPDVVERFARSPKVG